MQARYPRYGPDTIKALSQLDFGVVNLELIADLVRWLCAAGGAIPGACTCPPMCADYEDTTAASKLSASCVAQLYLDAGCTKDGILWTNWDGFRTYGNYWRRDASDGGVGTLAGVKADFAAYAAAGSGTTNYAKCRGS